MNKDYSVQIKKNMNNNYMNSQLNLLNEYLIQLSLNLNILNNIRKN